MLGTVCRVVLFGGGLTTAALACGGQSATPPDGGSATDGGPRGDSGGPQDGGGTSPCPAAAPSSGAACTSPGLACEYGSSPVQDCDTVATCSGSGWQLGTHNPGGLDCKPAGAAQCPASFSSVPRGTHCDPYGTYCDYPEGRCACSIRPLGAQPVDASAIAEWICQDPSASGCPSPRAPLGSACAAEGLQCDYGTCGAVPGGTAQACHGGIWVQALAACPAIAGRAGG